MSYSATKRSVHGVVVRLDLAGDLRDPRATQLLTLILDAIIVDYADELIIDLDAVRRLESAAVWALVCGYEAAVECGTVYRVLNAHGQVQNALQATGMLEVLADSRDIGAVLVALALLPDPGGP